MVASQPLINRLPLNRLDRKRGVARVRKRLLKRFDRRACMLGSVHILDTHYLKFFGSLFEGGHHVGIKNIALPWGEQFVVRMNYGLRNA